MESSAHQPSSWRRFQHRVAFSAFSHECLTTIHQRWCGLQRPVCFDVRRPEVPTCCLFNGFNEDLPADWVARVRAVGAVQAHLLASKATPAVVAEVLLEGGASLRT